MESIFKLTSKIFINVSIWIKVGEESMMEWKSGKLNQGLETIFFIRKWSRREEVNEKKALNQVKYNIIKINGQMERKEKK